ncbi:hypothetical protein AAEO56_12350 [Flavobacterium sp. DGU11]|uniref:Uncharacterized protein n=1 Tax=Flavobacterium arundinis TaxID=3139143 RepID=A0ABU9HY23_9FLAO
MKQIFYIINYTYFICVGILLIFTSVFYLGGKEQLQLQLGDFWRFVLGRIAFNEIILVVFLLFLFLVNFFFQKSVDFRTRLKLLSKAFLWLTLLSVIFVFANYSFR